TGNPKSRAGAESSSAVIDKRPIRREVILLHTQVMLPRIIPPFSLYTSAFPTWLSPPTIASSKTDTGHRAYALHCGSLSAVPPASGGILSAWMAVDCESE